MYEDLIGHKFSRWTVLDVYRKPKPNGNGGYYYAKCICECGTEKDVLAINLKSGQSKSCGCLQREVAKQGVIDLTGKKFGRLLVLRRNGETKHGDPLWETRCECGTEKLISGISLREGRTQSCGCWNAELVKERGIKNTKDLTGQRFGRYIVIEKLNKRTSSGGVVFLCRCDCGQEKEVSGHALLSGAVVSCGCYGREQRIKAQTTHGLSKTKEYNSAKTRRYMEKKVLYDTEWTAEMESFLRRLFKECVVCGMTEEEHISKYGTSLHIDHVSPLKFGNGLRPDNATILCHACNSIKHTKELDELPDRMAKRIRITADLFALLWNSWVDNREISSNG